MTKTLFIYHGGCFDGFTAAWVYSRFVDDGAEFVGVKHGDQPPDVRGRDVIIADFSFPRNVTNGIIATAKSTTLLDHHVTAREALEGIDEELAHMGIGPAKRIVFDMDRSGAGIVWDELACRDGGGLGPAYRGHRPKLVDYVEDRDLWRMKLPNTHQYAANVYAAEMTFEAWDVLKSTPLDSMIVRARSDFAVSEVAKHFGGGGHKQAAGFDVAELSEVFS